MWDEKAIRKEKLGGLLGVNRGSGAAGPLPAPRVRAAEGAGTVAPSASIFPTRSLASPMPASPGRGGLGAWLFYVTADDQEHVPATVWRHASARRSADVRRFEETDERFFVAIGSNPFR